MYYNESISCKILLYYVEVDIAKRRIPFLSSLVVTYWLVIYSRHIYIYI